uniref:very-long-chain (3R)-3-hydroxyacyl-CoA dehydratase PASTICCINO 2-like n=1 Tax=Erigeron canadensis TaxID=72917 RepID=UPI001CB8ABC7|nr:very-long-chain (3R)-3-hydroxyacyl-CoA dehydratase PASTICCINO 2-like [Erigeron canadensis]
MAGRMYLMTYNWLLCTGWFYMLCLALKTLITVDKSGGGGHAHVYQAVEIPLLFAQSAAFFEVLHSLIVVIKRQLVYFLYYILVFNGLVRSQISATLPQISSRLFVVWGILYNFPQVQTHPFFSSMVISWCITEIIRYSFFAMKETFGSAPFWLLWLRYSTFLVLYPSGIASEIGLIYKSLPYIKESGFLTIRMPNAWNFSFDYFYCAIMVLGVYVPGVPHLYGHMLGQRKKSLSRSKRE